ncbi:trafficking protein particle complex subunit 6b isoform X3 [Brachyhypopomus gauderio]|uniref:trafficking protein particle complex subunit 6b isoform X3 n=1 Tax=Brachyhypopomus gauderio TaxID=698409 RepID=UPI0040424312
MSTPQKAEKRKTGAVCPSWRTWDSVWDRDSLKGRFTKDTARFKDELDVMKFICKDFWTCVFKKQIDNLRTNHQGIYVLQDNKFRLLTQLSAGKQYLENAPKYLAFPCGLVRGALSNLGVKSIVTAEVSVMPACKFQVMIQKM